METKTSYEKKRPNQETHRQGRLFWVICTTWKHLLNATSSILPPHFIHWSGFIKRQVWCPRENHYFILHKPLAMDLRLQVFLNENLLSN